MRTRARNQRGPADGTASAAVGLVRGMLGDTDPSAGGAADWVEVAEMLAELNLDADCIAAGLAGLLVEREAIGLETARPTSARRR